MLIESPLIEMKTRLKDAQKDIYVCMYMSYGRLFSCIRVYLSFRVGSCVCVGEECVART